MGLVFQEEYMKWNAFFDSKRVERFKE